MTEEDEADVSVAGLLIVKDTSTPVVDRDGTASFTVQVINSGDVALTDVVVDDPAAPGLRHHRRSCRGRPGRSTAWARDTAGFVNTATVVRAAVGEPTCARRTMPRSRWLISRSSRPQIK